MKKIPPIMAVCFWGITAAISLTGCAFGTERINYNTDMPKICEQQLKDCFGEEAILSDGVEKEERFFNEFERADVITHYTEWELIYENAAGQEGSFLFNNRIGRKPVQEHLEDSLERYFCDLTRQYYQQQFFEQAVAKIPGCMEDKSVVYFQPYRLFSMPDVPETTIMFDERLHYSLSENIYFPQLQYDAVFRDFPYILNMYFYVGYQSAEETERIKQRREIELSIREVIDEMARYTGNTLNATASVTMMDDRGAVDGFSLAVLNGTVYEKGRGTEFEIALHENFFGPIDD